MSNNTRSAACCYLVHMCMKVKKILGNIFQIHVNKNDWHLHGGLHVFVLFRLFAILWQIIKVKRRNNKVLCPFAYVFSSFGAHAWTVCYLHYIINHVCLSYLLLRMFIGRRKDTQLLLPLLFRFWYFAFIFLLFHPEISKRANGTNQPH